MKKFAKYAGLVVLLVCLTWPGARLTQAVVYNQIDYQKQHWDIALNNFIAQVQADVTFLYARIVSLGTAVANWSSTVDLLTLISTSPVFSDDHTFTLVGNYSSLLTAGKRIIADCGGTDGLKPNTIVSCTYSAPNSTVVVTSHNLTSNLVAVSYYATRNGLNTYGSGDIVAGEYGAPSWANLQSAISVANASGRRLLITPGTWPVSDDIAIIVPLTVAPTGLLQVATSKTLTISFLESGPYQTLSCVGTGKVVFAAGSVEIVYPEWWGATVGGASCETALNAAAIAAVGRTIALQTGTYNFTSWSIPAGVNIGGQGPEATILAPTGNASGILGSEQWYHQTFRDFCVTHANNINTGNHLIDANLGAVSCEFDNIKLISNSTATGNGLFVRGQSAAGGANNACYNNRVIRLRTEGFTATESTGAAISMGVDATDCRANANFMEKCVLGGFNTGIYLEGQGNIIGPCTYNSPTVAGISLYQRLGGTYYNTIMPGQYFDTMPGGSYPVLITCDWTTAWEIATIYEGPGLDNIFTQVGLAGTHPEKIGVGFYGRNIVIGTPYNTVPAMSSNERAFIKPYRDNGLLGFAGGPTEGCGKVLVSGKDATGLSLPNMLSRGGVGLGVGAYGDAAIRLFSTINGLSGMKLFEIAYDGGIGVPASASYKTITAVDATTDQLTIAAHGLVVAQRVTFRQTGGADPGGLTSGTRYYVIVVDVNTIMLAASVADANAGTAIDITSAGSGTLVVRTGAATGSVNMPTATSVTVDNPACNSTSMIIVSHPNAASITYEKAHGRPYPTAADGHFTLTGDGTAFVGTESYKYMILN